MSDKIHIATSTRPSTDDDTTCIFDEITIDGIEQEYVQQAIKKLGKGHIEIDEDKYNTYIGTTQAESVKQLIPNLDFSHIPDGYSIQEFLNHILNDGLVKQEHRGQYNSVLKVIWDLEYSDDLTTTLVRSIIDSTCIISPGYLEAVNNHAVYFERLGKNERIRELERQNELEQDRLDKEFHDKNIELVLNGKKPIPIADKPLTKVNKETAEKQAAEAIQAEIEYQEAIVIDKYINDTTSKLRASIKYLNDIIEYLNKERKYIQEYDKPIPKELNDLIKDLKK